jgi:primosomal protein N''
MSDGVMLARVNLRDLARQVEEAALVLEAEGFQTLPGELMTISERLTECRQALERLTGSAK